MLLQRDIFKYHLSGNLRIRYGILLVFMNTISAVRAVPPVEIWRGHILLMYISDDTCSVPPVEIWRGGPLRARVRHHVQPRTVHLRRHGDPAH